MKLEIAYHWAAFRQGVYARLAAAFGRKAATCERRANRANVALINRRIGR